MTLRCLLLALTVCAALAPAQAPRKAATPAAKKTSTAKPAATVGGPEVDPNNVPLVSIEVSGNKFYKPQQVIGASGVAIGQVMKQPDFDAMKARLEQTGAFEVVSYRYDPSADGRGYALKIEVVEALQLFPYRFDELPAPDSDLRKVLEQKQALFADRIPPTRTIMDSFAATLTEYLAGRGFKDTVIARVINEAPHLEILFQSSAQPLMIGQIDFKGYRILDLSTLANAFAPVAIGTPSRERDIRALLDSGLRPVFEAKGLMRVTYPKITAEKMKDVEGAAVTIEIVEGPRYQFGDVRMTGSGMTNKEAMSYVDFKTGDPVNMDLPAVVVKKLKDRLRHYGYMANDVSFERKLDDKRLAVDITFKLDPGERYTFGQLDIKGLDITTEPFIRKMWALAEGKPYNASYPQHFLDEVKEQGILDNLKSSAFEEQIDKQRAKVSVTLTFVGGSDKPAERRRRDR